MASKQPTGPILLYVEDEGWQIEGTVSAVLEIELGATVVVARGRDEARAKLKATDFDVIILDVMMESRKALRLEETTLWLAKEARSNAFGRNQETPIVLATGVWDLPVTVKGPGGALVDSRVGEEARQLLGDGVPYVKKPFTGRQLADKIQGVLSSRGYTGRTV